MEHKHWLEKAIRLDMNLNIYDEYAMRIADLIYSKVERDCWRKDRKPIFSNVVANLRVAHEIGIPVYYSRDTNRKYNGFGGRSLIDLIDAMAEEELIDQHNGYNDSQFPGKRTRMWPSQELISLFIAIQPEDIVLEPPKLLVQLTDRPPKINGKRRKPKLIPYQATVEIQSMERQLKEYGEIGAFLNQ